MGGSQLQSAMNEFLPITCPHCGEVFDIACGSSEGDSEFITDCEVCCRPMTVTVRVRPSGGESVSVQPA